MEGKYSWLKTPRWKDHAMEVGPLARLLVAYAKGSTEVKDVVNEALGRLGVPVTALFSTLGRTAARGLETRLVVHWMKGFYRRPDRAGQESARLPPSPARSGIPPPGLLRRKASA